MNFSGLEKLSLVDYDEVVSATVFTAGCNFRCGFCHNSPLVFKQNLPEITEEEVLSYLKKRSGIIEGGCISGGEPTLEKGLLSFIEKLKTFNLKVKLDTNGTNPLVLEELINKKLLDYVAMDIKNDKKNYAPIIGLNNFDTKAVEKSVEILKRGAVDYEFRTTLIKEFHTEENIIEIVKWIKGAKKYALQKYVYRDTCISQPYTEVPLLQAEKFKSVLKPFVENVVLRGY